MKLKVHLDRNSKKSTIEIDGEVWLNVAAISVNGSADEPPWVTLVVYPDEVELTGDIPDEEVGRYVRGEAGEEIDADE